MVFVKVHDCPWETLGQEFHSFQNEVINKAMLACGPTASERKTRKTEEAFTRVASSLKMKEHGSAVWKPLGSMEFVVQEKPCFQHPKDVKKAMGMVLSLQSPLFKDRLDLWKALTAHLRATAEKAESPIEIAGKMEHTKFVQEYSGNSVMDKWRVSSKFGPCRLSARSLGKQHPSTEINWEHHNSAVLACERAMDGLGIGMAQQSMEASLEGSLYHLDTVFTPCKKDRGLSISVTSMAQNQSLSGSKREMFEVEDLHREHGTFRLNHLQAVAPSMMQQAYDVTVMHVKNQTMKAVLKMREGEQSAEVQELTGKHDGRYIKSEETLQALHTSLKKQLTKQELSECDRFWASVLKKRRPIVTPVQSHMVKAGSKRGYEVTTVQTSFDVKFHFDGTIFKTKPLSLHIGNRWCIQNHSFILYPTNPT